MNVLVTALGSMSSEAVIGALRSRPDVARIVGTDIHPPAWIAASELVDACVQVPRVSDPAAYVSHLMTLCERWDIDWIVPLTDLEVDVLSSQHAAFQQIGTRLAVADERAVATCRDKFLWQSLLRDMAALAPALPALIPTALLADWHTLDAPFPWLAKPATGRSSENHIAIASVREAQALVARANTTYIVQPRLPGSIHVVDIVRQRSTQTVTAIARTELLRTSNGAGTTVRLARQPVLESAARAVATALDTTGAMNMEFIEHAGTYRLMDINPRLSAGTQFTIAAGYDIVGNHLRSFDRDPIESFETELDAIMVRGQATCLIRSPHPDSRTSCPT
ncbi:MAG: ATP-grasp domain-containing protein [Burkholderiaceae bacterium]|nr:ATP-grasp domain-containing protein [Burkholderiaceae bacterium]